MSTTIASAQGAAASLFIVYGVIDCETAIAVGAFFDLAEAEAAVEALRPFPAGKAFAFKDYYVDEEPIPLGRIAAR